MSNLPTITEHLPVTLDHYRTEQLQNELRDGKMEEMRIAEHLKKVSDSLRDQIKEQQKKQKHAAISLTNGYEMKPVSCEQKIEGQELVTYRLDTNEELRRRPLSAEERLQFRKVEVLKR